MPEDFDVFEDAEALGDAMAGGGERWRRCLLQIARFAGEAPRLTAQFDDDGTSDWVVTPPTSTRWSRSFAPDLI